MYSQSPKANVRDEILNVFDCWHVIKLFDGGFHGFDEGPNLTKSGKLAAEKMRSKIDTKFLQMVNILHVNPLQNLQSLIVENEQRNL